jgi:hypothetical protein
MIKFIKKIWSKLFGKKEVVSPVVVIQKPTHCPYHKRFRKSCSSCVTIARQNA